MTTLAYEDDIHVWTLSQIEWLRQGQWGNLDIQHLIEELESMAGRDRRELESHFIILIAHLLKWEYQFHQLTDRWHSWQGGSWQGTIIEQRAQLAKLLRKVPSLKRYLVEAVAEAYPDAVNIAVKETKLSRSTFPLSCPYTIEQLLDEDFWPASH